MEVVLFETCPGCEPERLIGRCDQEGIPVHLVPRNWEAMRHGARMGDFLGFPALQVSGAGSAVRCWEKRLFDSLGATCTIALLCIPYLIIRFVLALSGRGMETYAVLGRRGQVLQLARLPGRWPGGALFTALREFPTLLLWLRGQWSLVGIVPLDAARLSELPEAYRRFPPDATPGWITLAGNAPARSITELSALNREYAGRWSLALDVSLLLGRLQQRKGNR
jgi:lipopolysaccharide/colanic/teichoic acid biosynthesis glycosyltransferase